MAKKTTAQKTKRIETRTKHPQEMIYECLAWFDFETVKKAVDYFGFWSNEKEQNPSIEELKETAYDLLVKGVTVLQTEYIAFDDKLSVTFPIHQKGFQTIIEVENGEITGISLNFILESWDTEAYEALEYTN